MNIAKFVLLAVAAVPLLAQSPVTVVLVNLTVKPGIERAEINKVMPQEVRDTVRAYLDGKIQQWYSKADGKGVMFLINCKTVDEAKAVMEALPLAKGNLVNLEYTALAPLNPLRALLGEPGEMTLGLAELPCACATARQAARVVTQFYDARLRKTGMEAPQFTLMLALEKLGASSQREVGRRLALDKTTVSRNLRVLERNGWIAEAASKDKRQRQFAMTAAGRRRLASAKIEWKKAQDELRSGMSGEEWDAMFRAFRNVTQVAQRLQS